MPDSDIPQRQATRRFGGVLRLVLFYLVVVAGTLGVYFIFYVDARVEQTIVRNFRAMDAAAVRLSELITNLHRVTSNVPVGVNAKDLNQILGEVKNEVTEVDRLIVLEDLNQVRTEISRTELDIDVQTRQREQASTDGTSGASIAELDSGIDESNNVLRQLRDDFNTIQNKLGEFCNGNEPVYSAVQAISSISELYLNDFDAIPTATQFSFHPLPLREGDAPQSTDPAGGDPESGNGSDRQGDDTDGPPPITVEDFSCSGRIRSSVEDRLLLRALGDECELGAMRQPGVETLIRRRLTEVPEGIEVEARDCRRFSTRSPDLDQSLPKGAHNIVPVLDRFGVGVRANLTGLVNNVATNVAPLFDQFLIADRSGRVIYSADIDGFRYQDVVGAPIARRARLDFANHVNVQELVSTATIREPSLLDASLEDAGIAAGDSFGQDDDFARFGIHSRVENLKIGDMTFRAFVHPFQIKGLEALPDANGNRETSAVLYMIGIVDRESLSSESIRLRFSFVAGALLLLGVLVSLLSLLWLWTAGDRIVLKSWHPVLFVVTGLTAVLLHALFSLHLVYGAIDDRAMDRAIEVVSNRIRTDVRGELGMRVRLLTDSTVRMLAAGEAPARNRGSSSLSLGANGDETRQNIERSYYCRIDESATENADAASASGTYAKFDLAFLLDSAGKQWQCLSNRLFDTRPIELEFRPYFARPKAGRLWTTSLPVPDDASPESGTEPTAKPVKLFAERITSILDGTTETVLAARPADICASGEICIFDEEKLASPADLGSAVIIGRLHSLEDTILPPHVRFAVIDNSTGMTLFHSVGSRSLATNFIREVEVDDSLLSLVDSGGSGFVDLDYYGSSIRAYVQPLVDGLPWTLVTYRGYELADTLNIITVSTTAAMAFGALLILFLMLTGAKLLDEWARARVPWWYEARDAAFSIELLRHVAPFLLYITIAAVVMLIAVIAFLPEDGRFVAAASIVSVPILLGILIWRQARAARAANFAEGHESSAALEPGSIRRERGRAIGVTVMIMATLTIIPATALYVDVRARVGFGTTQYLREATEQAIVAKCERQTAFVQRFKLPSREGTPSGVFEHGWTLLPAGEPLVPEGFPPPEQRERAPLACSGYPEAIARLESLHGVFGDRPPRDPQPGHGVFLAASTFSGLGSDIARRSLNADPGLSRSANASLGNVLDTLLGSSDDDESRQAGLRLGGLSILTISLLLGAFLLWTLAVSLTDRVFGMRLRLAMLPVARLDPLPESWRLSTPGNLRACVIHRSDKMWKRFLAETLDVDDWRAKRARWTGEKIVWDEIGRKFATENEPQPESESTEALRATHDDARTLYVVEGFERFIVDAKARDRLVDELERISTSDSGILIWSRVIPGTWLADLTDRVSGDLASVSDELALTSRWSQVLGPFDVRRLTYLREHLDDRFEKELAQIRDVRISDEQYGQVCRAMHREARANPELLELAASVVRYVCTSPEVTGSHLSQLALQRFRASAASHFHTIWAASSRSERLQLYALARGGFANPTQTITLSSLANRGLITTEGAVRLQSEAFKRFIVKDLDHDSLLAWRDAGHGNIWRSIWPPILLVAILATAFFVSSTPEALAPLVAILAASLGIVPVIGSVVRGMKEFKVAPSPKA